MDLSSMNSVMNRIQDIEYKVGLRRSSGGAASFQQTLEKEMKERTGKAMGAAAGEQDRARRTAPTVPTSGTGAVNGPAGTQAASAAASSAAAPDSMFYGVIREAAEKYGIDPKLVSAVAEVESGFEPQAVSATGAVGVMQLMPETADSLGVNPYDPSQNIDGGARYLKQMLDTFDGDLRKAVAAYNAGPEAVREYGGVPPYRETQQYVSSVLDLYR